MIITIGADGKTLESMVSKRFGHAPYFITYNSDTNTFRASENIDPGHTHSNLSDFVNGGTEAFIVGNIGPHAFKLINTKKSKAYLARKMTVAEAVKKLLAGELKLLTEPTAKRSIGHGHHQR